MVTFHPVTLEDETSQNQLNELFSCLDKLNDTKIIFSDSTYINGNSVIYSNGVISDACLNPGETGTFNLLVAIPDSINVTYWTKEIRAEVFE